MKDRRYGRREEAHRVRESHGIGMICRTRAGFTLIELLVVIAIISLLVSILLPSLSKAKLMAGEIVCMMNLRGMHWGWTMYLEDHQQVLPFLPNGNWRQLCAWHKDSMTGLLATGGYIDGPPLSTLGVKDTEPSDMWKCPVAKEPFVVGTWGPAPLPAWYDYNFSFRSDWTHARKLDEERKGFLEAWILFGDQGHSWYHLENYMHQWVGPGEEAQGAIVCADGHAQTLVFVDHTYFWYGDYDTHFYWPP